MIRDIFFEVPPAPAYKGVVLHVADPEDDLRTLTTEQLSQLFTAIDVERSRRYYSEES